MGNTQRLKFGVYQSCLELDTRASDLLVNQEKDNLILTLFRYRVEGNFNANPIRNVVYCLDQMSKPIDDHTRKSFVARDAKQIMMKWINNLEFTRLPFA